MSFQLRFSALCLCDFRWDRNTLGGLQMQNWKTKHTVVDGQRLYFDGTGAQLFGNWIKWFLLTIITFGIYGFWLQIKMEQWIVKHTHHV